MTLAANTIDNAEIVKHINHERLHLRLTLIVSILAGPMLFLLLSAANANFAQGQGALVLLALTAIAFESTWIIYAFGTLICKAIVELWSPIEKT
jgi:hypothetical protein